MLNLLNVVLPTFIVILIGFILGKKSRLDMTPVVEILFWVGLPALTFVSMLNSKIVLTDAAKVWAAAVIISLGCGIVAWITFTALRQKHSGLYLPIAIMNTVNIPFPIIYPAYGSEGLVAATLFYIPNIIMLYSIGVLVLSRKNWKDGLKEMLRVPPIYAALIGLTLNLLKVPVPALVTKPLDILGQAVIPLALLILGAKLASVKITSVSTTLIASFIRLGVGLAMGLIVVILFHFTGVMRAVIILDSAMPAAVNTSMLAMKYNNETELVSSVVFATTIASLVLIPFLLKFLT